MSPDLLKIFEKWVSTMAIDRTLGAKSKDLIRTESNGAVEKS